jgi:hypothetical protein
MTDRALRQLRRFAGQRHDLAPLLSGEGLRRARPRVILQAFDDRCLGTLKPMSAPQAHRRPGDLKAARHFPGIEARGQH